MAPTLRHITATELDEPLALQIAQLRQEVFFPTLVTEEKVKARADRIRDLHHSYIGPPERQPVTPILEEGGKVVAAATGFARTVGVEHGERLVLALSGVACDGSLRGKGYGRVVVEAVFQRLQGPDAAFDVSLFQTPIPAFYEHLGGRLVNNRFTDTTSPYPDEWPWSDPFVMIHPATAPWHGGMIDLRGPRW